MRYHKTASGGTVSVRTRLPCFVPTLTAKVSNRMYMQWLLSPGKNTSFIQSVYKSLFMSSELREAYYLWDGGVETRGISYNFHKSPYLRLIFTQPNIWPLGLRNPTSKSSGFESSHISKQSSEQNIVLSS